MDNLTQKGLDYINAQKGMLTTWAREQVLVSKRVKVFDDWIGFDMTTNKEEDANSKIENVVVINIWLPDDEKNYLGNWRAGAYPMEINSVGEVQTNTQDFVKLF